MVAKGFKGNTYGDINLWGIEKPISVPAALRLAKQKIVTAKKIDVHVAPHKLFQHTHNLLSLLNQVSRRIRTLRGRINGEHYLRLKIVKLAHNQALDRHKQFAYRRQLSYHSALSIQHVVIVVLGDLYPSTREFSRLLHHAEQTMTCFRNRN